MSSLRDAALFLFQALDALHIPYAIGGSFASSIHGISRSTQDLDIVAGLNLSQVDALAAALQPAFYAEAAQMRDAIRQRRSFKVIHLESAFKMDIFPATSHPLGAQELARRQFPRTTQLGGEAVTVPVISAEDIVLAKLLWYRDGGETSERQWNDLRNIVQVQGRRLDLAYLQEWSRTLEVSDLLSRLLA